MEPEQTPKTIVAGVRLSPEELAALDRLCNRLGMENRSDGLRALIRGILAAEAAVGKAA